jgi:hypothetical protein
MNQFIKSTTKGNTRTLNNALSNSSTGSIFVDDFGTAALFRDRSYLEVSNTMSLLWSESPELTMRMAFYLRNITRKIKVKSQSTEVVQKGQGIKDEFLKRILWVAQNYPSTFYKNFWLIPVVGSYRDVWQLMYYDEHLGINCLDRKKLYAELVHDLADDSTKDLFLKYMPLPKASSKLKTERAIALTTYANEFRLFCGLSNKDFRKMKVGGNGHKWQQLISKQKYKELIWGHIPGKALFNLVKSKFIDNQDLNKNYLNWIKEQPVAKYTGYPHELGAEVMNTKGVLSMIKKVTYDKQFEGLVQKAKEDQGGLSGNVWCALDTSGSMTWSTIKNIRPYDVCISLGVYFSALNEGAFKDHVIMFDNTSKVMKLGGSFTEKIHQITSSNTAWGSTNFQSVIDEICRVRRANPDIPIEDYPDTLLVVSDMEFNPTGNNSTNYDEAMKKLKRVGLPKIRIIWWKVNNLSTNFPSTIDDEGTIMISGYDGSILTLLLGGEQKVTPEGEVQSISMEEALNTALSQEIFNFIEL